MQLLSNKAKKIKKKSYKRYGWNVKGLFGINSEVWVFIKVQVKKTIVFSNYCKLKLENRNLDY